MVKAFLAMEWAASIPDGIIAKKYIRLRFANCQIARTQPAAEEDGDRRRDYLLRFSCFVRRPARWGRDVVRIPFNIYGAVHHYSVILVDGMSQEYAFLQCLKSAADRGGVFGFADQRRETECFSIMEGAIRYVHILSIDAVVGSLLVKVSHVASYTREVFSPA